MTQEYNVKDKWLTKNQYSRPGTKINKIKGIVIHWVANPMSTALENRNYFENRKYGKTNYGSAHEIISLDGDIVRCVPEGEITYNCGSKTYTKEALVQLSDYPNNCTYSIECTHVDWSGQMTDETYQTLIKRVVDLCEHFNLDPSKDVWLHKEIVGWKDCHRWFVNNPTEWKSLKEKIAANLKGDDDKLELKEQWQWDMLAETLEELYKKGTLNSNIWSQKAFNKDLTVSELTWLNTIIIGRKVD